MMMMVVSGGVYMQGRGSSHLLFKAQREHLKDARRVGGECQASVRARVNAVSARTRTALVKRGIPERSLDTTEILNKLSYNP
ncbi:hypothetical protein QQF64_021451 [Cirrhinus molitorella]|uniref:Uncharacterized protein n=1 Tax=Cirrhinus molitorella TaxID=172907 RepID=A0ABR3LC16_9TELE